MQLEDQDIRLLTLSARITKTEFQELSTLLALRWPVS
jgi:hypothetical protein